MGLIEEGEFRFCWIVDFPLYEWNEAERRIDFSHNPFSMPQGGLAALAAEDPLTILGRRCPVPAARGDAAPHPR